MNSSVSQRGFFGGRPFWSGLLLLVLLHAFPLSAATTCDCTVLVIDASVDEAALERSLRALLTSAPSDGKRMIGAVVHDSVVRFVVPLLPDPNIDREIMTVVRLARELGADSHSNYAVAVERAIALFSDAGEQSGRRQIIVTGKGVIDTGDASLDEQYRQWLDGVLLPGLADLGVEIRMQAAPAEVAQASAQPESNAADPAPAEDGAEHGGRGWIVAVLIAAVAVGAVLLFVWVRRRRAATDEESPAAPVTAPEKTVVRTAVEAPEKTVVRPAVSAEAAATQARVEAISDEAAAPDEAATDVTDTPEAAEPSPDTTQIRPDKN